MPTLQVSAATAALAHSTAFLAAACAALQSAHDQATARANKIASRERNLITTFALGAEISQIRAQATHHHTLGELSAYIALNLCADRLQALLPDN